MTTINNEQETKKCIRCKDYKTISDFVKQYTHKKRICKMCIGCRTRHHKLYSNKPMKGGSSDLSNIIKQPTKKKERKKCEHGKRRHVCPECGGGGRCIHNKNRYNCIDCGTYTYKRKRNTKPNTKTDDDTKTKKDDDDINDVNEPDVNNVSNENETVKINTITVNVNDHPILMRNMDNTYDGWDSYKERFGNIENDRDIADSYNCL